MDNYILDFFLDKGACVLAELKENCSNPEKESIARCVEGVIQSKLELAKDNILVVSLACCDIHLCMWLASSSAAHM